MTINRSAAGDRDCTIQEAFSPEVSSAAICWRIRRRPVEQAGLDGPFRTLHDLSDLRNRHAGKVAQDQGAFLVLRQG